MNLENCAIGLANWSRSSVPNIMKEIREVNSELERLQKLPYSPEIKAEETKLKMDLELLLDSEETLWKQRAKTQWLAEGDQNTRFFHAQASK